MGHSDLFKQETEIVSPYYVLFQPVNTEKMSRRNGARSASTENQRIKKMCDEGVKVGSRILSPAQL